MNYEAFEFRGVARLASLVSLAAVLAMGGCDSSDDDGTDSGAGTGELTGSADTVMMDDGMDDGADSGSSGAMDDGMDDGQPALSHAADIQPLWDMYCVEACHSPTGEWPTNDMSGNAYMAIVSKASAQNMLMNYVEPGDPDKSYLWHKMQGTQVMSGGSGLNMPKARVGEAAAVVPQADLDKIEAWILQGAPE